MRHALAVSSLTPVAGCFSASYGDRPFIAMRCTNIQGKVSGAYHSAYIDRVIVRVFYRGTEGTITTELIPKDAQADAWESVEASQNVPAQRRQRGA
jgi:hypothetical protein